MAVKNEVSSKGSDSRGATRHGRKKSWAERVVQLGLGAGGVAWPSMAASVAFSLWCHPRRHAARPRELESLAAASVATQSTPGGTIKTYTWQPRGEHVSGAPDTVLLLHGWEGRAGQMAALGAALSSRGFRAIAIEAPSHGATDGPYYPTLFQIADALRAVAQKHSPIHAVIAHSAGTLCLVRALADGLPTSRIIAISGVSGIEELLIEFVSRLQLSGSLEQQLRAKAASRFGANLWHDLNVLEILPERAPRALLIHDRADADIDYQESVRIARAWPGAELKLTQGLGHRRILVDPDVIEHCLRFVAG